jgi:uncharacterized protein with HEPN domain
MRREAKKYRHAQVDQRIVWDIIESKLPTLRRQAADLLEE